MHCQQYLALITVKLVAHANSQLALQMKAYLRNQFEFLGIQTPTRRAIYKDLPAIQKLLQTDSWWQTVDSRSNAIGDIVLNDKLQNRDSQNVMDEWLLNSDFWVRRSAMIHQLGWRQHTDTDRLSHYAMQLSGESEFFIRKAIGWAFRDYSKHDPVFVRSFMDKNGASFSNLTVSEATKNLKQ